MSVARAVMLIVCFLLTMSSCAQTNIETEQRWTPRYENADILEFVKLVQEATGKMMVIDPRVNGQVTVMNDKPLNERQLYELFLATLNVHGYTAVEVSNIVRIVPTNDVKTKPTP